MVISSPSQIARITFILLCSLFALAGSLHGKNQIKDELKLFSLSFQSEKDWKSVEVMTFRLRMESMLSRKMNVKQDGKLIGFAATRKIYEDKKGKRAVDTYVNSYWNNQDSFFDFLESGDSADLKSMLMAVSLDPLNVASRVLSSFMFNISKEQPIQVELFFNGSQKTVKIKVSLYEPDFVKHFNLYRDRYITAKNFGYYVALPSVAIFSCYAVCKWFPWLPAIVLDAMANAALKRGKGKNNNVVIINNGN